ncbi:hypothetical protein [Desertimonas flava]|uniref:GREB1-related protein n=1 Tax=Desertimonas flava TaxID=2064846 RepID=UPI000E34ED8F|nr:hypothetical protein [Desertimonas flava]
MAVLTPLLPLDDSPEEPFTIVVPSKGRPNKLLVKKMLPAGSFKVLVEPGEAGAYREANPDCEIVEHPKEAWPYSRKVQWAYETFGSIVSIDDDMERCWHYEHGLGDPECTLSKEDTVRWISRTMWEARQAGAHLVGFFASDIRNYDAQNPFKLVGWMPASAMGILSGSKLHMHSDIVCSADYWICLLNMYEHRYMWVDNRIVPGFVEGKTFKTEGGISSSRTIEAEKHDFELLERYFGNVVRKKQGTVRAKVKHIWQKQIYPPF